jgi:hypothetical protein
MFEILIKFYIISEACLKIHPRAKATEIEEAVAETLKHAPSQKDGPKYKKVGINLFFMVGLHTEVLAEFLSNMSK